ncbi:hypothetical protein Bbelb_276320 [Branchiostoma belcheri]|nr:hypothetical protein Bbelb_276320 [Branchiostoma belcheri]
MHKPITLGSGELEYRPLDENRNIRTFPDLYTSCETWRVRVCPGVCRKYRPRRVRVCDTSGHARTPAYRYCVILSKVEQFFTPWDTGKPNRDKTTPQAEVDWEDCEQDRCKLSRLSAVSRLKAVPWHKMCDPWVAASARLVAQRGMFLGAW